jgi:1,4-alpha-glucan branching enzyme
MQICFVSQEYPPARHGGLGTQTFHKAHGLAALGHQTYVVTHSPDDARHESADGRVHVIRIPGGDAVLEVRTEPVRWLTYSVQIAAALAELQARSPLDLIDFAEWGGEGYVYLLNRTPWNSLPCTVQLHGPLAMFSRTMGWPEPESDMCRTGTAMESTSVRLADAVYSSSRCSVDWCVRCYGLTDRGIPIIHTGVDAQHFRRYDVSRDDRPTIVFVGRLVENKGVELLTEAALRLAAEVPGLRLRLVGGGETRVVDRLRALAHAARGQEVLELAGFVSSDKLPEELSRADVFAAPSIYEGGPGFVYLEAMSCELPVIACAGSGAAECVRHGENGLLVPPRDLEELIAALRELLGNPELRLQMGKRGRRYVEDHAERQTCLRRLERFYQEVVERCRDKRLPP